MLPPLYLHVSARAEVVAPFARSLPPINTVVEARERPKAVLGFDSTFKRGSVQIRRRRQEKVDLQPCCSAGSLPIAIAGAQAPLGSIVARHVHERGDADAVVSIVQRCTPKQSQADSRLAVRRSRNYIVSAFYVREF